MRFGTWFFGNGIIPDRWVPTTTGQGTSWALSEELAPLLEVKPWLNVLTGFSIKVPNGPLTSRLQHLKPGDAVVVGRKPTGTLVIDNLLSGRNLYLLGTGTGLAPFLSIIKDPETYARFEKVVLVHGDLKAVEWTRVAAAAALPKSKVMVPPPGVEIEL